MGLANLQFRPCELIAVNAYHQHLSNFHLEFCHDSVLGDRAGRFLIDWVYLHTSMGNAKYIVVEGPIGVGKSSLARILANEFQARTVFERIEDNPFLPKFYKSRETYAFQNQTFFLL